MATDVLLRDVTEEDIPIFFEQQLDPAANYMAAFTARDPADRAAFMARWDRIRADDSITKQTILLDGQVAGSVVAFVAPWSSKLEVAYWIGRAFWGKGIATRALAALLRSVQVRPIYARAARDNIGSLRVLEKCGFTVAGYERGFAHARGEEVEEVVLELREKGPEAVTLDWVADLSDADHEAIRLLSLAVYPPEQFADWPGRSVEWSAPEWCVRIRGDGDALASYVGVYVRQAEWDGRAVRVGGIGNVKTHPAVRRRGLASLGIRRAVEFFREQPALEFALLLCEPHLLNYYARLGWREFGGRLLVRQRGVACAFAFNRVMTQGIRVEGPVAGTIDLCGPPW